jgi:hypothetical protein
MRDIRDTVLRPRLCLIQAGERPLTIPLLSPVQTSWPTPIQPKRPSKSGASGWAAMAKGKTPCSLAYGGSGHFPQRLVRRYIEAALDSGGAGGGERSLI